MQIVSRRPLSDGDRQRVEEIFRESKCPYESLRNTFPRFSGIVDDLIIFDELPEHYAIEKECQR